MNASFRLYRLASLAAVALLALGGCLAEGAEEGETLDESEGAAELASCSVTYSTTATTAGTFNASVTITNQTGAAYNGWNMTFSFPNDQKIMSYTDAIGQQSGTAVKMANITKNAVVASDSSVSFGFRATADRVNAIPTQFRVNGLTCSLLAPTTATGAGGAAPVAGSGSSGAGGSPGSTP